MIDYLGAKDTPYVRAATRKFMVAAVARILTPGCKYDYVLTLVGAQGVGKSTLFARLGGEWFSDSLGNIQSKEAYESLQGAWIMEIGELAGLRKADAEAVKHFVSKTEDRYRVAYGRRTEIFPRQCVFAGTTNMEEFLNDPTGNRRWWPVQVGAQEPIRNVADDLTPAIVAQLWAESLELFSAGEPLYLDKELTLSAYEVQSEHRVTDDRAQMVADYLDTPLPAEWLTMDTWARRQWLAEPGEGEPRQRVSVLEIWTEALRRDASDLDARAGKEVRGIMASIPEWEQRLVKVKGVTSRGWTRKIRVTF